MEQEKIRELLDRYFNGETDEEEELLLMECLRDPALPESIREEYGYLADLTVPVPEPSDGFTARLENVMHRAVILTEDDAIHGYNLPLSLQTPVLSGQGRQDGLVARLEAMEYEMLVEALRLHRGNSTEAARELGLTRRTMGLRMKKHRLDYREFRRADQID